jgi:hypothetical protein
MSLHPFTPILVAGAALLLVACAVVAPPEYAVDHPANPAAASAPPAPPSDALSSYRPARAPSGSNEPEQQPAENGHAHH